MDNDKTTGGSDRIEEPSTGGFDEVPVGKPQELPAWCEIDASSFCQPFTAEDTQASLAQLAVSARKLAGANEKQARYTKVIASSLRRMVDEQKNTNRALWQIVGELKQIKQIKRR